MNTERARIWSETLIPGLRRWHCHARRGNVSIRGITLSWTEALAAVRSHLEAK